MYYHTRSLIILELEQILVKRDLCPVQVPVCSVYKFVAFVLDKQCIVCLRCTCRCKVKTQTSGSAI